MEMLDRITFDPKIMGGRACIRGMRMPLNDGWPRWTSSECWK